MIWVGNRKPSVLNFMLDKDVLFQIQTLKMNEQWTLHMHPPSPTRLALVDKDTIYITMISAAYIGKFKYNLELQAIWLLLTIKLLIDDVADFWRFSGVLVSDLEVYFAVPGTILTRF